MLVQTLRMVICCEIRAVILLFTNKETEIQGRLNNLPELVSGSDRV